jgi:TonB family protein
VRTAPPPVKAVAPAAEKPAAILVAAPPSAALPAVSAPAVEVASMPAPAELPPRLEPAVEPVIEPVAAPAEDEEQAVEIKLREFVAPELNPSLLATLGASNPRVLMRFTVEPDGRVSEAKAREGTPRRLAQVASRAILQWRFEPIAAAQEVEVELAFKRE